MNGTNLILSKQSHATFRLIILINVIKVLIISNLQRFPIVNHKNSSSISNNTASAHMDTMDKKFYNPVKNEDDEDRLGNQNKQTLYSIIPTIRISIISDMLV